MRQPSVPERVRSFLAALKPAPMGLVVAVSGGADSVALLRSLAEVHSGRLVVAHFNHGLRGAESEARGSAQKDLVMSHRRCLRAVHSEGRQFAILAEAGVDFALPASRLTTTS